MSLRNFRILVGDTFCFQNEKAAREVLGEDSPDWAALVLRVAPAPGLSIREMCRERYGWHHSRSELYRRSNNGAMWVATSLSDVGIAVPERLQTGPPS